MILVTGATGFIGKHLVERLLQDGYPVRCLLPTHHTTKTPWETDPDIIVGTLMDSVVLYQAMSGVNTVIHLENAQWWGYERDLERVEVLGTRNLVEAARSARVGRIITLSHLGATPSAAYPLMRVKGRVEEIIRSGGTAYTIIRSGVVFGQDDAFINHIAMQLFSNPILFLMPGRGEVVLHPIYIHDLVEAITQTLENLDTVDQVVEIGGPEYITLRDLIRTVMRVSGRERLIVSVPPYTLRWINQVTRLLLPRTLLTPQWLDLLATNRVAKISNLTRYYTIKPHRLEDTLLTYLPGANGMGATLRAIFRRRPRSF